MALRDCKTIQRVSNNLARVVTRSASPTQRHFSNISVLYRAVCGGSSETNALILIFHYSSFVSTLLGSPTTRPDQYCRLLMVNCSSVDWTAVGLLQRHEGTYSVDKDHVYGSRSLLPVLESVHRRIGHCCIQRVKHHQGIPDVGRYRIGSGDGELRGEPVHLRLAECWIQERLQATDADRLKHPRPSVHRQNACVHLVTVKKVFNKINGQHCIYNTKTSSIAMSCQ